MIPPSSHPERTHSRRHPPRGAEGAAETCTLDRVHARSKAEVVEVHGGAGAARQLAQLGIFVGALLDIRRRAPLGGPVMVEIRGNRQCTTVGGETVNRCVDITASGTATITFYYLEG